MPRTVFYILGEVFTTFQFDWCKTGSGSEIKVICHTLDKLISART
jgi:hypothetical protein